MASVGEQARCPLPCLPATLGRLAAWLAGCSAALASLPACLLAPPKRPNAGSPTCAPSASSAFLPAGLVALSLGLASFSLAGLYCNHADLSPRYASVLLGLTNTTGALPGIVGVAITGGWGGWAGGRVGGSGLARCPARHWAVRSRLLSTHAISLHPHTQPIPPSPALPCPRLTAGFLFDRTGSWGLSLFAPSIFLFLTGSGEEEEEEEAAGPLLLLWLMLLAACLPGPA